MTSKILNEGLDYLDMVGQIDPKISVDEYEAKNGKDSDIVTIAFTVNSEAAGNDLVDWFERGYDWIVDASLSEGEVSPGKSLVFVELNRRSTVPLKIVELLTDLKTLTDFDIADWSIKLDSKTYKPEVDILKQVLITSPHDYRMDAEKEINEIRQSAGIPTKDIYEQDAEIRAFKAMAGL